MLGLLLPYKQKTPTKVVGVFVLHHPSATQPPCPASFYRGV